MGVCSMSEYVRMYRSVATSVLFGVVALLAGFDATADKAPDGQPFAAARGDRTSGWLAQTRSEVLARNGVVATSQPLAAQTGLQILKAGGKSFDAAVASAGVLNL